jgi:NAD(P)-dependent dehydrogenase (short-subunit alcohol dehydrogenase family)
MDPSAAQLFDLGSKVALVTGGAKGIGRGIAEVLAAAGAAVAVADIDIEGANSVAQALQKRGLGSIAIQADVAQEESVKALVQGVYDHFKRLDILVNNAGIFPMKRLRELDAATWDRTNGVNLRGAYLCTRHAAERIIAGSAGGRIINISTINTARTYLGMAHYDASKYGLNALTKASALEYAPFGITVNAIAPGAVKTPGSLKVRSELGGGSVEAADAEFAKRIPLGRWAEPEDIGRAVLCLTGRAADYITGQIIYVDGGLMLGF